MKLGRNDPCPCGSGKKFKHCCSNLSQVGTVPHHTAWGAPKEPTAQEQNQLIAMYQAGQHTELENQASLLVKRYPDSGFMWKILSAALSMQGKDDFPALQRAANLLPRDAQVHNNLGDKFANREMLKEAESWFRSAIRIQPKYFDAHYNLGQVLIRQERLKEASILLKKAIEIQPNNVEAYINLANALKIQGLHDEAEAQVQLALHYNPTSPEILDYFGNSLVEKGLFSEAEKKFRQALAQKPDAVRPRISLVNAKKIREGDEDFEALRTFARTSDFGSHSLSTEDRIGLHFALGKAYDDLGDSDEAFSHFSQGCKLRRATFEYDARQNSEIFDEIIRAINSTKIKQLHDQGDESPTPIFILGMPRSGTTLTEQIIASHPDVYGAGELTELLTIVQRNLAGIAFPKSLHLLNQTELAAWGREYVSETRRYAPKSMRITDKMPENFIVLGLIHLLLPNAKIIHVKRNAVDTCLSCFTKSFANKTLKFSYDLRELGQFYVDYVRLMEHWRNTLPENSFLEVQYEDLIQDTEGEARRLIEYCGLDWNNSCLDFHKNDRSVRTASVAQVRQPIYRSSMERWRRYEKHLGPLLDVLGDLVPGR